MNCQEARELLYEIIDKEASQIDAKEVQRHLENCRHCTEIFELETKINELIGAKLNSEKSGSTARFDSLKSRILERLDGIDREKGVAPRHPFDLAAKTMVAAAALIVLVGSSFWGTNLYRHYHYYAPLERAHQGALANLTDYSNPNHTSSALSLARSSMHFQPFDSVGGYHFNGGCTCDFGDSLMAHFVYTMGGRLVSVFVAPAVMFDIPASATGEPVMRDATAFYVHNCDGCKIVYHHLGETVVITVTSDDSVELLDFVPGQGVL